MGPTALMPGFTELKFRFEICWKYAPTEALKRFLKRNRTPV